MCICKQDVFEILENKEILDLSYPIQVVLLLMIVDITQPRSLWIVNLLTLD